MVKTNYANAYKEVLVILDNLIKEDQNKTYEEKGLMGFYEGSRFFNLNENKLAIGVEEKDRIPEIVYDKVAKIERIYINF